MPAQQQLTPGMAKARFNSEMAASRRSHDALIVISIRLYYVGVRQYRHRFIDMTEAGQSPPALEYWHDMEK